MINPKDFCLALSNNGVNFYSGVPDSLLKDICAYITDNLPKKNHKITANEGSAIGLAIGYYMSTKQLPLVYMQNSGLGNAVNPLVSLADKVVYSIPMLLMIGWRGEPGVKDEPQHSKQGQITEKLLEVLSVPYEVLSNKETNEEMQNILKRLKDKAIDQEKPVALLIKKNTFQKYVYQNEESNLRDSSLTRNEVLNSYVQLNMKHIVVSTTGVTSRELLSLRKENKQESNKDFLTVGGMGHASQIALGIAINKPNTKVVCIDGDGSLLMHMGSLASIVDSGCKNYIYFLLNNFVHDSVGGQPIGAKYIDFSKIAESCGFKKLYKIETKNDLINLKEILKNEGPVFVEFIIKPGFSKDLIRPEKTPIENKKLLMNFLSNCN